MPTGSSTFVVTVVEEFWPVAMAPTGTQARLPLSTGLPVVVPPLPISRSPVLSNTRSSGLSTSSGPDPPLELVAARVAGV